MGWSELTAAPELDRIFKKLKLKYTMRRVLQPGTNPVVQIMHEKRLSISIINEILAFFPEAIYIEFVPDTVFMDDGDTYNFGGEEQ